MSFKLDDEFGQMAIELINEFCEQDNATYVSIPNDTTVDNSKPWQISPTAGVNHSVRIIFFQKNLDSRQFAKYIRETEIVDGVTYGLMYPGDFEVRAKDIVIFDGTEYVINAFDTIKPVDKPLLYIIEFGK